MTSPLEAEPGSSQDTLEQLDPRARAVFDQWRDWVLNTYGAQDIAASFLEVQSIRQLCHFIAAEFAQVRQQGQEAQRGWEHLAKRYMRHDFTCPKLKEYFHPCLCGLDAALRACQQVGH